MVEAKKYELAEFVQELENYRGRHTELITVYIPAGYNLNAVVRQLEAEKSTANNIKSKTTRKNVIDALEKLVRFLKQIEKLPENGLAVFCGNVSEKEGEQDIRLWSIEPPYPLKTRLYRCDQEFVLDPLREMLESDEIYGLFVIERKEATIGLLEGKQIRILQRLTSGIPGKQRAGGQSSQRFERLREGMAKEFYRRCADALKEQFFHMRDKLKGILVGGPGPTKEEFLKEGQLVTALKEKIIAVKDIGYADEHGLELLVEASQDVLSAVEVTKEKQLLEEFFTLLAKQPEKVVYGKEQVVKALDVGAVDKLLISEKIPKEERARLEKKAEETGASIEIISTETNEGLQFYNLGGVGAFLRFSID